MEPIGTITNYFPFLEEETVHILKDVMDQASDYYDFVLRLGNKVCNEDVSLELVYCASKNAFRVGERDLQDKLRKKFHDTPEILVWTFPTSGVSEKTIYRDQVREVLNKVIEASPPDWILLDLFANIESSFARNSSEFSEALRKVEAILECNQDLACFEVEVSWIHAIIQEMEGDSVSSILSYQRALELAREVNDVVSVTELTAHLALLLRNHNTTKALEYIEEYNRLSTQIGIPRKMFLARHFMGLIHLARGEYDMALECQFAAIEVYYQDTGPSSTTAAVLSTHYSDMGDGQQALYWANESLRIAGEKHHESMHSAMLRALLLVGRLEDAEHHLDELHRLSLESATEDDQANLLYMKGLYESKSGSPQAAIDSLEQALLIYEQLNIQIAINRCLIALTKAEIQLAGESGSEDCSGPWMVRLESHARKKDYPGIQMHAALLRAEFLVKQGRKAEARDVLQDALDILDAPTVKTLRIKIQDMLDDLIVA